MMTRIRKSLLKLFGRDKSPDLRALLDFHEHLKFSCDSFSAIVDYANTYIFLYGLEERIKDRNLDILKVRLVAVHDRLHEHWSRVKWEEFPDFQRASSSLVTAVHRLQGDLSNGQLFMTRSSVILGLYDGLLLRLEHMLKDRRNYN